MRLLRPFIGLVALALLSLGSAPADAAARPDRVAKGQVKAFLTAAAKLDRRGAQTIPFAGGEVRYTPGKGTSAIFTNGAIAVSTSYPTHVTPHAGAALPTTHEGVNALLRGPRPVTGNPARTTARRFKGDKLHHTERTFADGSTLTAGEVHMAVPSHPLTGKTLSSVAQNGPSRLVSQSSSGYTTSSTSKSTQYRQANGTFGANGDSVSAAPVR